MAASPTKLVEGQHIFPDDELHQLAVRWKELNAQRRDAEAMVLLEQIVQDSTAMFERLAQHEKFHHTVDLQILVSAAQEKVVKWLLRWDPKKGKLFTWFAKCAKHAFLSELLNVNRYRKRFYTTDDNLEKFIGTEDHTVDKHDLEAEMHAELSQLTCRWGHPQEIGCLVYLIDCILDEENRDRRGAIRGAAYAWGIPMEQSTFFYRWALTALRGIYLKKLRTALTDYDLICLAEAYSLFVDLVDIVGLDNGHKVMGRLGGNRIKIPSLAQMLRLRENYQIYQAYDQTVKDPDALAEVAAKFKRTPRSASDAFETMSELLNPQRAGEYYLYRDNDEHN